jgi:hypothetical protein
MANDKFISGLLGLRGVVVGVLLGSAVFVGGLSQGRAAVAFGGAVVGAVMVVLGLWSLRRAK